mmetsp:Transcript_29986/g.45685  ORF Transcript_29986/g.45685 Transcript_29986/m.45685 type:complete len:241 (+) Transcript_29986:1-723(+)
MKDLLQALLISRILWVSMALTTTGSNKVIISVCTGPDCRVDGSSDCLRRLQKDIGRSSICKEKISVQARKCLGPCGDGPLVTVRDTNGQKVVIAEEQKPEWQPGSLVPADIFGDSTSGVYQVRTNEQANFVLNLAAQTAGLVVASKEEEEQYYDQQNGDKTFVSSQRQWFDRPRNERKVLQRLAQVLVVAGLLQYDEFHDGIGSTQWNIAIALFFSTNFMMKDNIVDMAMKKWMKKRKIL